MAEAGMAGRGDGSGGHGDRAPGPSGRGLSGRGLAAAYLVAVVAPVLAAAGGGAIGPGAAIVTLSGLAGLAMLLAQFVTSGRFEWVSGRIGLDVTMGFHRIAGVAVLVAVLIHVLAVPTRLGLPAPDRFLSRLVNALVAPANLTGLVALVLLVLLVAWAKGARGRGLPYEAWRLAHGVGALAVIGLAVHHALSRGDALRAMPVAVWIAGLGIVAVGALVVVYLARPRTAYAPGFEVETVRRAAPSVVEVTAVAPSAAAFSFRPGQFAWIAFGGRHTLTDHPFSIASAPEELPRLRFLVREAGDGTRALAALAPGTPMAVDGPHGTFVERIGADAVVLVAGGIGIAPILSILRSGAARGDRRPYRLALAVRTVEDLAAVPDLADLRHRLDLRAECFVEEATGGPGITPGRIDAAGCSRLLDGLDPARSLGFVCGPPAMMDAAVVRLLAAGLPAERIVTERFDYDAARDPLSAAVRRRFLAVLALVAIAVVAAAVLATSGAGQAPAASVITPRATT
jgi:predicted ferric reductase